MKNRKTNRKQIKHHVTTLFYFVTVTVNAHNLMTYILKVKFTLPGTFFFCLPPALQIKCTGMVLQYMKLFFFWGGGD